MKNIWSQSKHMVLIYSNSPRLVFLYPAAFCSTQNGVPSCFSSDSLFIFLFHGTEFRVFFFRGRVRSRILRLCFYFCSRNWIPSFFLFRGRVRNGIPRGFCSAEQLEFNRKWLFVASIPSSTELFFCWKFSTLVINLLLVFPSVLMSPLLLVYPAVPVFFCAAVGQSGNVFLLLLFFHWSPWYS